MSKTEHSSFRFDCEIKKQFQNETYKNGVAMTETLQNFMETYVKVSKAKREQKK